MHKRMRFQWASNTCLLQYRLQYHSHKILLSVRLYGMCITNVTVLK